MKHAHLYCQSQLPPIQLHWRAWFPPQKVDFLLFRETGGGCRYLPTHILEPGRQVWLSLPHPVEIIQSSRFYLPSVTAVPIKIEDAQEETLRCAQYLK